MHTDNQTTLPVLNVIGLMSGTSMDAIDAACIRIQMGTNPPTLLQFNILGTHSMDLPDYIKADLDQLLTHPKVSLSQVCELDRALADCFAQVSNQLVAQLETNGFLVDLIASHGQTVYHQPPTIKQAGVTLQLGNPAMIAQQTHVDVIGDFRPRDMAVGGQGAPLVPFADVLLFQDDLLNRAVQNIGGIANVTVVPSKALTSKGKEPFAFDTGPGNMVIDGITQRLFNKPYDENGAIAQSGRFNTELLAHLMKHPFLSQPPPKSTGREAFGDTFVRDLLLDWHPKVSPEDLVATATHFTAISIVESYKHFVLPLCALDEVIVGGGGTQNSHLMRLLTNRFKELGIEVTTHQTHQIPNQYKEAIAFALLGYASKFGIANNLTSCTGASEPVVLGGFWPGKVNFSLTPPAHRPATEIVTLS